MLPFHYPNKIQLIILQDKMKDKWFNSKGKVICVFVEFEIYVMQGIQRIQTG